ncbi:MAG: 50S ribosomal protein L29 [Candidatus Levybacteria bacterium]|nr:50S ribosomal protein L29 [Candidatus Levybacteria bacterium]MBI2189990.1 50S ribosomal protein L29 [Candidatus Levybacteria bacterium]MBI2622592.1 50S ribosomal protein L29 [Candidatus Levybacteria bacterium]MBI3070268.1 50S ribosomal protein L29 [Candidatus Levybacteria bacterium]MBI3092987.1 50S ribosomal protein L29 [Candidatus Levybacteria bacterium]
MKSKDIKELHAKAKEELKNMLLQAKNELFSLKMQLKQNKLKNKRLIFLKRKDIARMITILKEKESHENT